MNLEKLRELLSANGVDEETINKVVADLEKEDETKEDESTDTEEKTDENDGTPNDDGKSEEDEPNAESDPADEDDDLPPGTSDGANGEGNPAEEQPNPNEVPPADEVPPLPPEDEVPPVDEQPPVPPFDPTELLNQIQEQNKVIEGLTARIESLEDVLKSSGVLSGEESVGVDQPTVTPSNSASIDDAFDTILSDINKRAKRY